MTVRGVGGALLRLVLVFAVLALASSAPARVPARGMRRPEPTARPAVRARGSSRNEAVQMSCAEEHAPKAKRRTVPPAMADFVDPGSVLFLRCPLGL